MLLGALLGMAANQATSQTDHVPWPLRLLWEWSVPLVAVALLLLVAGQVWLYFLERPVAITRTWNSSLVRAEVLTAPGAAVPPDTTVEQAPEETGPGGRGRTAVPGPAADRIPAHERRYGRTIDLTHDQAFTSLNGARPWKPRRGDSGFNGIDRRRSRSGRLDRTTQPRREEPGATGPWYREFECDSLTRIASCI